MVKKTEIEKTLEELGFRVRDDENKLRDKDELAMEIIHTWDELSGYGKLLFLLSLQSAAIMDLRGDNEAEARLVIDLTKDIERAEREDYDCELQEALENAY